MHLLILITGFLLYGKWVLGQNDFHSYYQTAYKEFQAHRFKLALSFIEAGLRIEPANENGLFLKAQILKDLGNYEEAHAIYHSLLVNNDPYAVLGKMECLNELGQFEEVILLCSTWQKEMTKRDALLPDFYAECGDAYLHLSQYDSAYHYYSLALTHKTDHLTALLGLGQYYVEMNQPMKAIPYFKKAISNAPTDPRGYYNQALAFFLLMDYDSALSLTNQALQIAPEYVPAYELKARTLLQKGNASEAMQTINVALNLSPRFSKGYLLRARIGMELSQFSLAESDLQWILHQEPNHPEALFHMSLLFIKKGEFQKALTYLNPYLQVRPDDPIGYYNRGLLHEKLQNFEKAIEDYEHAIVLQPDLELAYLSLASLHVYRNHYQKAKTVLLKLVNTNAMVSNQVYLELAYICLQLNQMEECSEYLRLYQEKMPKANWDPRYFFLLGQYYSRTNQNQQAIKSYQQYLSYRSDDALAHYNLANSYLAENRFQLAEKHYNHALALNPHLIAAYINKGVLYMKQEKWSEAYRVLDQAKNLDTLNNTILYNLGVVCYMLQKKEQACTYWEKAIQLGDLESKALFEKYCQNHEE